MSCPSRRKGHSESRVSSWHREGHGGEHGGDFERLREDQRGAAELDVCLIVVPEAAKPDGGELQVARRSSEGDHEERKSEIIMQSFDNRA